MFSQQIARLAVVCIALVISGCATPIQGPVNLAPDYFSSGKVKSARIGVAIAELPKPNTDYPGADCLLCMALANAAHSGLNAHVVTLGVEDLAVIKEDVVATLKKKGLEVIPINEPLKFDDFPDIKAVEGANRARKDFTELGKKHQVRRLLVMNFTGLGVRRTYASYIPTDVPKAILYGSASIIDLDTQELEWMVPIQLSRAADGPWDESPNFPGLTNAYYQVIESAKDLIIKPLER